MATQLSIFGDHVKIKIKTLKKRGIKYLLVSVSGGRSSAIMAYIIATSPLYADIPKLFIFANTGKEREETLLFLVELEKLIGHKIHWVEAVVTMQKGVGIEAIEVDYRTASRNGEPFKAVIEKESFTAGFGKLPNISSPYCSGRLKERPIHKFAKEYFGTTKYTKCLGMRLEDITENNRISWAEVKAYEESGQRLYPLLTHFDYPLDQQDMHRLLPALGIDLGIDSRRGNCDLCNKKSEQNLVQTLREGEVDPSFWIDMELATGDKWYRGNTSIFDLIEKAKSPDPLESFCSISEDCFCGG